MTAPQDPAAARPAGRLRALNRAVVVVLLGIVVFGMMVLTFADVAGRYLFNAPLAGAKELTEVLLALMVFGAAPLVTAARAHITTGLFEAVLKGTVRRLRDVAVAIIGSLSCGVLAWRLWVQADAMRELKGGTQILDLPLAPIFYVMAVLSGLCAVLVLLPASGRAGNAADLPQ